MYRRSIPLAACLLAAWGVGTACGHEDTDSVVVLGNAKAEPPSCEANPQSDAFLVQSTLDVETQSELTLRPVLLNMQPGHHVMISHATVTVGLPNTLPQGPSTKHSQHVAIHLPPSERGVGPVPALLPDLVQTVASATPPYSPHDPGSTPLVDVKLVLGGRDESGREYSARPFTHTVRLCAGCTTQADPCSSRPNLSDVSSAGR